MNSKFKLLADLLNNKEYQVDNIAYSDIYSLSS